MTEEELKPNAGKPSPAKQGALIGLSIGVALVAGRLASDSTRESLGYIGSVAVGILASVIAAIIVAIVAQRLLFSKGQ